MTHGEADAGSGTGDVARRVPGGDGGLEPSDQDALTHPEAASADEASDGEPALEAGFLEIVHEFKGPLPPVPVLEGYERIVPGSAQKIIDAHLHGERTASDAVRRLTRAESFGVVLGSVSSALLTVGGLGAAVWLLLADIPSGAIAAVIPSILGGAAMVVSAYRKGKS